MWNGEEGGCYYLILFMRTLIMDEAVLKCVFKYRLFKSLNTVKRVSTNSSSFIK